jgi:hypothetical protein
VISLDAAGLVDGKNQNHRLLISFGFEDIDNVPAYDSPILKSTSGRALPFTENSSDM